MSKYLMNDVPKIVILSIVVGVIGGFGAKYSSPLLPDSLLKIFAWVMILVSLCISFCLGNIIEASYLSKNGDGRVYVLPIIIVLVILFFIISI